MVELSKRRLHIRQFDESFELSDPGRVAHLTEGFRLDLSDTLTGDLELAAHFFKRSAVAIFKAKSLL